MHSALTALLVLVAGCGRPSVDVAIVTDIPYDGGVAACSEFADLRCVNFLAFDLLDVQSGEILGHCVRVTAPLDDLCEVAELATGAEVFRVDPDEEVRLSVRGLRVYPATSCQTLAGCPARELFTGQSGAVRLGDLPDGRLELPLDSAAACGPREEFYPRPEGRTCDQICGGTDRVVCDGLAGGCLCLIVG